MGSSERFYHEVSLRGPVPDRLLARLPALCAPDPGLARRLGEVARADAGAFFAEDSPGYAYAQGFDWLGPLSHAEGGRHVAGALFEAWAGVHGRYAPRAWAPGLAARRSLAMLAHAPLLLEGRDGPSREQVFAVLIRQVRHLAKAARRAPAETRLLASCGLMAAALCLPGAAAQERSGKAASAQALAAAARGELPDALRRPSEAQALARTLLRLRAAYKARGLTAPQDLGAALTVLRLYLGALALPEADTLAVLPGGQEGDPALLTELRLLRRAEADALLSRYGYARLGGGQASVHVDLQGPAAGAFALSAGAERVVTAAGAPAPGLRAVSGRMRDWTEALGLPAAAATLDAPGYGPGRAEREDAEEGSVLTLHRRGPEGAHARRLYLTASGAALIGEDEAPAPGAVYRFPLAPGAEPRPQEGPRVAVVLASGRSWRFEAANAAVAIEDGVYAGGGAPTPARQVVVRAEREGLRWAWRRS